VVLAVEGIAFEVRGIDAPVTPVGGRCAIRVEVTMIEHAEQNLAHEVAAAVRVTPAACHQREQITIDEAT
jgi:hypothetical protein